MGKLYDIHPLPDTADFLHPHQAMGIHGLGHETRVMIWAHVLSESLSSADKKALIWAAKLHDTHRWDEGNDPEHGERAALQIEQNTLLIPHGIDARKVAYLCRWHVPDDERAPEMTQLLRIFKDADALDRHRIDDLDPSRLRTEQAQGLVEASYNLWYCTFRLADPRLILLRAMNLGIRIDNGFHVP